MTAMDFAIQAAIEHWPIAGAFVIARGAKTAATVVVVTVRATGFEGRGECAPYARYGETPEQVCADIEAQATALTGARSVREARDRINARMPAGAARNALDCALWDLEARVTGGPVWRLAGLDPPAPVLTAWTISLGAPEDMAEAARASARPLLKLKLGGDDAARVRAVRSAAPGARLIVDANESWTPDSLAANLAACVDARVELVEQPFPAGEDTILASLERPIPVCADESAHDAASLAGLADRYDVVNIKLDKTGGLTGAMAAVEAARALGLRVMLGCMVSTSLSMAPALLLASRCDVVDLDGPLILRRDRANAVAYIGARAHPAPAGFWGERQL